MCCLQRLSLALGRMVLHGTWCSRSGWELRGAGPGAAGPDPALPSSRDHVAAWVQEDPEPSLGTLGAPRAGGQCPMAGGDVPGQGAMPRAQILPARQPVLPAGMNLPPDREGALTGLAAAKGSNARISLPVCGWVGTGEPLRSLQPFHYPLMQVTLPGNLLPRASGWFLWSWVGGAHHAQHGSPVPGTRYPSGQGSQEGTVPRHGQHNGAGRAV